MLEEVTVSNKRRRKHSSHARHNPRRRHRSNPSSGGIGFGKMKSTIRTLVTPENTIGAIGGLFLPLTIPKLIKWDSGWKDIAATGATVFGGTMLLGATKTTRKMAMAFGLAGLGVLGVKVIRMALGKAGVNIMQVDDVAQDTDNLFAGIGDEPLFGQTEPELFGTGTLEPTFTGNE